MSHPLFWTAADFDDPFSRLTAAFGELEHADPVRMFDLFGAERPEDATLPMSYWTKKRIVFLVRESEELRPVAEVLEGMPLRDLRAVCLVKVGNLPTGRIHDWASKEWRHTDFYSLDTEWIGALARSAAKGARA